MKKLITTVALGAALSFSASQVFAFELAHNQGTIKTETTPKTIATFDLATLDSLKTLGVDVAGVTKSNYDGHLAEFNNRPVVGTLFEPDFAALKQLNPDLIFAARRSLSKVEQLQEVAPVAVLDADVNNFLQTFNQNNLNLAKAFGKQKIAKKELKQINKNIKQLQKRNQGQTGAFLFVINDFVIPHAPGNMFGYAYEITGLQSVLPAASAEQIAAPRPAPGSPAAKAAAEQRAKQVSAIAQAEPDWLIVMDRGSLNGAPKTAEQTLANHPEISQTQAFKNGRVYYTDITGWYVITGGLTNFKQISEDLLDKM